MKASELRIGNWITINDGENPKFNIQINLIESEGINDTYDHLHWRHHYIWGEIEPIELTPDILDKAGFKKVANTSKDNYLCFYNGIYLALIDGVYNLWIGVEDEWYEYSYCTVQHLHHLQNLYWCLCGKELEINL